MKEEENTEGRRHQSTDEHDSIEKKNGDKGRGWGGGSKVDETKWPCSLFHSISPRRFFGILITEYDLKIDLVGE